MKSSASLLLSVLAIAAITSCAHPVERRDWSGYQGPGAEFFHRETLDPPRFADPLEPVNRVTWDVNDALIVYVANPVGQVYRLVIPRFVRDRIRDFAANVIYPRNLFANLLQGKLRAAGTETARFAVNTTVGVAGFWDPAARWLDIEASPEDFGQVFGAWGWRPSTYVVLPLAGPSSLRDGVGMIPDSLLDPAFYFFPAGPVLTFNQQVDSIDGYRRFAKSSYDAYDDAQLLWTVVREEEIEGAPPATEGDDTGAVQTLEAVFFGPRDPGFAWRLDTREIALPAAGRVLPYSVRMQPGRAPLAFVVPGLGAHRFGASSLALAEMAWDRGFSVVIVSSAMNFEFIERGASVPVPGHAPVDAHDVHIALDRIADDLGGRYGKRIGARVYMGYSLGAFHGFFIAAEEARGGDARVGFDRYLLLDPPVRLIEGMERLDAFLDVPLAFPPDQRAAEVDRILRKAARVGRKAMSERSGEGAYSRVEVTDLGGGTLTPDTELPFTNDEAEVLIGLAFRRSLQEILYASQERDDLGVLLTKRTPLRRRSAYQEIGDYSFAQYLFAFVYPYYHERLGAIASAEEMIAMNDLHAIAEPLRGNPKLRVFANRNDFLNDAEDIAWLTALVGPERTHFFPTGGHLGNLHRPDVQAKIMATLDDLREPAKPGSSAGPVRVAKDPRRSERLTPERATGY